MQLWLTKQLDLEIEIAYLLKQQNSVPANLSWKWKCALQLPPIPFFSQFLWRRNSCHHYDHILNFRFFILNQAYTENDAKRVCDLIGLSSSKKMFKLLQWKPFKVLKNAFYFILKALFVLQIFVFLSWLFNQVEKTA